MTPPADQSSNAPGRGGGKKPGGGGKTTGGGGKDRGGGGKKRGGGGKPGGGGTRTGGGQGRGGGKGRGPSAKGKRPADESRADELAGPLKRVLERLPATQREVLEWRMGLKDGHPHDVSSTAEQLGMSVAETREIEQRAFEHIREVVPLAQLHKLLGS